VNIDSLKRNSKLPAKKPKTASKKSSNNLKQSKKAWFFSILTIILVIILWFFGLRQNWQRINEQRQTQTNQNNSDINSLKEKFNELFGQTTSLIDRFDAFDETLLNTTSTASDIIETQSSHNTPTLTDEQINNLTNKLKNATTNEQPE
jgi:cytoskeletal protein RodZ